MARTEAEKAKKKETARQFLDKHKNGGRRANFYLNAAEGKIIEKTNGGAKRGKSKPPTRGISRAAESGKKMSQSIKKFDTHCNLVIEHPYPAVFDTNVILAAGILGLDCCRKLMGLAERGSILLCKTWALEEELLHVQTHSPNVINKFQFDQDSKEWIESILKKALDVSRVSYELTYEAEDKTDNKVLAAWARVNKISKGARGILFSRDVHLLSLPDDHPELEGKIVHPKPFLDRNPNL
jgi:predicted nucleic acid-binding protein